MKVTKKMKINEVIAKYPQAAEAMLRRGLHCIGCPMSASETIEQGCKAHGMGDKDIEKLLKEINDSIEKPAKKAKKA